MYTPLIINADDFGLSDGICKAIYELLEIRAVSNTTIMISAPGAIERLKNWKVSNLQGIAGIHLQLSDGKPISLPEKIPTLIDSKSGNFIKRELIESANPFEVEIEWLNQIEIGCELLGGPPSHLDSHQGVHRIAKFTDSYLKIASKYNIPVRGGLTPEFEAKMNLHHVKGSKRLIRDWTGKSLGVDALILRLTSENLNNPQRNLVEIVTHPGYSDEYLSSISALNFARENDLENLRFIQKNNILNDYGFKLVSYSSI